jgi:hypothetical protein
MYGNAIFALRTRCCFGRGANWFEIENLHQSETLKEAQSVGERAAAVDVRGALGDSDCNLCAGTRFTRDGELAVQPGSPFAHCNHALMTFCRSVVQYSGVDSASIVAAIKSESFGLVREIQSDAGCLRMVHSIGQGFATDPVKLVTHGCMQRPRFSGYGY